jgi:type II secretory pathway pseudopilin PulG
MNSSSGPHHKICQVRRGSEFPYLRVENSNGRGERGYTLVALLALMTVLAIFAAAAAPSIRHQAQREREVEAIFRGEQVAAAISLYYTSRQGRVGPGLPSLPTSVDQLLEGLPSGPGGTRKVQILRPSAARDPLSESGEWRLIQVRSSELTDFQRSIMFFAGNIRPPTRNPQLQSAEQLVPLPVLPTLGTSVSGTNSVGDDNSTGPFIGVASRSRADSIIYYYGIGKHSEWVFTPLFR